MNIGGLAAMCDPTQAVATELPAFACNPSRTLGMGSDPMFSFDFVYSLRELLETVDNCIDSKIRGRTRRSIVEPDGPLESDDRLRTGVARHVC